MGYQATSDSKLQDYELTGTVKKCVFQAGALNKREFISHCHSLFGPSLMSWLSQFFLNPAYVLPGAALVAVPILIHILSRLRYRRVRFAAMEFLLESEELNRRRIILEQLLLLLLRILAVALIVLLIAKLVLDPSRC